MSKSKFAVRMLEKQGWKEGDGLGKNRDGISKPIKAYMKRDKAGVGQDLGADLTDHWWMRVFNDAAKNSVTKTNEESEVKENPPPQNRLYAGFRKGSTLTQGIEKKDSDCSSEDDGEQNLKLSNLPTLDDIHKYCGGATGHRAATLGIKMTGKLNRAAEHERLFNERLKDKIETNSNNINRLNTDIDFPELTVKRKKKKKKDVEKTEILSETSEETACIDVENENGEKVKKKKSKKRKRELEREEKEQDEIQKLSVPCLEDETSSKRRKKSKRDDEKCSHSIVEENTSCNIDTNEKPKRKKKKKKKNKD